MQGSAQAIRSKVHSKVYVTRKAGKMPWLRRKEGPPGMSTLDPHNSGCGGLNGVGASVDS